MGQYIRRTGKKALVGSGKLRSGRFQLSEWLVEICFRTGSEIEMNDLDEFLLYVFALT